MICQTVRLLPPLVHNNLHMLHEMWSMINAFESRFLNGVRVDFDAVVKEVLTQKIAPCYRRRKFWRSKAKGHRGTDGR